MKTEEDFEQYKRLAAAFTGQEIPEEEKRQSFADSLKESTSEEEDPEAIHAAYIAGHYAEEELSSTCSNDPELLNNMPAAECPDSLAPNGNVIRMNAIQGGKSAAIAADALHYSATDKVDSYSEADVEAYKNKLIVAIRNREAGISRNPPHHIVLLSDEPDAYPIPYSSVFGNGTVRLKEVKEVGVAARGNVRDIKYSERGAKRSSLYKGSNYTPPKKKRKKR